VFEFGRQRMRCRMGHRWWSPLTSTGAIARTGCPRCWNEGEPINDDDEREEWVDDEHVD
jgi:hypothetical protein